jgi:transcriptional regulator with XRE-family HTH domain
MLKIGTKLIQLREKHGYTQETVCDKIGISQSNYSRIESDKLAPPADILPKIADLYNVNVNTLLGVTEQGYTNASNYKDNAFSSYLVYQDSQKQHEEAIEAKNETITALKALIESLQGQLAVLKNAYKA